MPVEEHPAFPEERERLDYTLGYVEASLENSLARKSRVDKDAQRARRGFNNEGSQEFTDMLLNAAIQPGLELKVRNLEAARSKPYFARMDFRETGKEDAEKLYLGKLCLNRDEDQKLIIVDWRAPIANLYYEGRLGEAGYHCPEGEIRGDLLLKRQFTIDDGKLREIYDIDITTNDQILQTSLGANADNRLKEIVATIQGEQNRIIRADMNLPLIVQGVAGSGKTTIALHRIAYLVYNFAPSFRPENFMIIAPNRLFLNYISEVLPELGVERVKQTTFTDFAMELIGEKLKLTDAYHKLIALVKNETPAEKAANDRTIRAAALKSSLTFKEVLERYVRRIEAGLLPATDFRVDEWVIYSHEEIRDLFYRDYRDWPILRRLKELEKHFKKRIKDRKDAVIERLQQRCNAMVWNYKLKLPEGEERQQKIIRTIDQKNEKVQEIERFTREGIKEYFQQIPQLKPSQYYRALIDDAALFAELAAGLPEPELLEYIRTQTAALTASGKHEIEDLAPLIYLKHVFYGMNEKIPVKHIVIDEAQDFSVFQFYVLKQIIRDSSFTILGDLSQGIHSYRGMQDWQELRREVFGAGSSFRTLEQSYRTTVEIMEAANQVLGRINDGRLVMAKPVLRHGPPVTIERRETLAGRAAALSERIAAARREGFQSVAVIAKTLDDCKKLHGQMEGGAERPLVITGKETEYHSGVVIVPSYLAKGLEFDVVLIADADRRYYGENELDAKLLYVAMTRPLHRLHIYYGAELTPLLAGVAAAER
jgi:DNA helicase-2/ATP-dependent DNA helicase PcrA